MSDEPSNVIPLRPETDLDPVADLTAHDLVVAATVIVERLDACEPPDDVDDLLALWTALRAVERGLGVIARQWSIDAAERVEARGDREYRTRTGDLFHVERSKRERWRGYDLLAALSDRMVDGDGELVDAIPTRVLRDVLPACGDEDATSSRWRTTGLRGLVDIDRYRDVEYGPAEIRTGPRR